ncbi:MAG: acyl-CoA reductase [Bacteroidetes bacterium]|nr:acyl-CoA reductase [Bacteroidota bacterium]MDA0903800.1 acyl-CoA reductase [Bacteroidota bacterium]MDA1242520.1 acyl-CoA reductase [Bacteroidota bacterium]
MYNANKLLSSLVQLGSWLREDAVSNHDVLQMAEAQNAWFTRENVGMALRAHGQALTEAGVEAWTSGKTFPGQSSGKRLGLILAGNLPLVGLSDIVAGVVAGHEVHVKLSSDDAVLPRWVVSRWADLNEYVSTAVTFHDGMVKGMDAIVATGSRNTSRYFKAYFGHLPHVFRGQRTSVAVLDGLESPESLQALGNDIFAHFGMGCRSVTKLYLPEDFDLNRCFAQWMSWGHLGNHAKYANNYDYHKAVWLLNDENLVENGFLLVKEDEALVSPIGTLFIERYREASSVVNRLAEVKDQIQVVTLRPHSELMRSLHDAGLRTAEMGENQCPTLTDHADGVDTLAFLLGLDGSH